MINRSTKPIPGKEITFKLPPLRILTLSNGLKVYFIQKKELPIARISLLIFSGSKFDPSGFKGLANLTSMCIDEGAGGLTAVELADEFELLGTNVGISTDADEIQISLQSLSNNFESALGLFSKIITSPALLDKEFEQEKRKLLTRLLQLDDEPDYLADTAFDYIVFGKDSFYSMPSLGTKATVNNIQIDSVRNFYGKYFSPLNSAIVVVGSIDMEILEKILDDSLKNWKSNYRETKLSLKKNNPVNQIYLVDKPGSVQTEIRVGYETGKRNEDKFFQRLILNTVLGGQFSSRINLVLREKHGYTYGAHSRISYYKNSGLFQVYTSVGIENTSKALSLILDELSKLREGITDNELEFAKDTLTKRFPLNFETYGQIAQNLRSLITHNLDYKYFSEYNSRVKSVNRHDVESEIIDFIQPERMTVILVCDKKKTDIDELTKTGREVKIINYNELFSLDLL